jgi:methyltransferase (TIGR00027 family)
MFPGAESSIEHVSDTALMVAACRALETERPDGLVRDPFAARLAGERGMAILRALPGPEVMCFGVGMRSRFLDDTLTGAIAAHAIETVLCFGAGLDTRPWRLDLPASLRWIEVDFPAMLDYKRELLASERPRCRFDRIPADLADPAQRQAAIAAAGAAPALLITEGLLMYLPAPAVEALAVEPAARTGVRHWILDLVSPFLERAMAMNTRQSLQHVRASDHLDGQQIFDVLQRNGWRSIHLRSYVRDAVEIAPARVQAAAERRAASGAAPFEPPPPGDFSGVHLFAHQ